MRLLLCLFSVFLLLLSYTSEAKAAEVDAQTIARRVGQVFAGYEDFWVWVDQRFRDPDGNEKVYRGRAYFKRDKMFRLNFGQPPFLVEGTDGDEYWIYNAEEKTLEYTDLDEHAPVHPLLQVFAAGDQMVKALDRFFNVDALEEAKLVVKKKDQPDETFDTYKMVLSLKPERLKEMREQAGNKLAGDEPRQWTFWVDSKTWLPRQIQVDWGSKHSYIFVLDTFNNNVGLNPKLFRRPTPPGIKAVKMKTGR